MRDLILSRSNVISWSRFWVSINTRESLTGKTHMSKLGNSWELSENLKSVSLKVRIFSTSEGQSLQTAAAQSSLGCSHPGGSRLPNQQGPSSQVKAPANPRPATGGNNCSLCSEEVAQPTDRFQSEFHLEIVSSTAQGRSLWPEIAKT